MQVNLDEVAEWVVLNPPYDLNVDGALLLISHMKKLAIIHQLCKEVEELEN